MIVAEITKDHIPDFGDDCRIFSTVGKQFDYAAMLPWWGWDDLPTKSDWLKRFSKIAFKLYDDDGELYYEGWLINDDQCLVQQFVLSWAQHDSGCTTIKVQFRNEFVQEIG